MFLVKMFLFILAFCVQQSPPDGNDNTYPKLHVPSVVILCLFEILHATIVVVFVVYVYLIRRRKSNPATKTSSQEQTGTDQGYKIFGSRVTVVEPDTRLGRDQADASIVITCDFESVTPKLKSCFAKKPKHPWTCANFHACPSNFKTTITPMVLNDSRTSTKQKLIQFWACHQLATNDVTYLYKHKNASRNITVQHSDAPTTFSSTNFFILAFCVPQNAPDGDDNADPKLHDPFCIVVGLIGLPHVVVISKNTPDGNDNAYPKLHVASCVLRCFIGILLAVLVVNITVHVCLIHRRTLWLRQRHLREKKLADL